MVDYLCTFWQGGRGHQTVNYTGTPSLLIHSSNHTFQSIIFGCLLFFTRMALGYFFCFPTTANTCLASKCWGRMSFFVQKKELYYYRTYSFLFNLFYNYSYRLPYGHLGALQIFSFKKIKNSFFGVSFFLGAISLGRVVVPSPKIVKKPSLDL